MKHCRKYGFVLLNSAPRYFQDYLRSKCFFTKSIVKRGPVRCTYFMLQGQVAPDVNIVLELMSKTKLSNT